MKKPGRVLYWTKTLWQSPRIWKMGVGRWAHTLCETQLCLWFFSLPSKESFCFFTASKWPSISGADAPQRTTVAHKHGWQVRQHYYLKLWDGKHGASTADCEACISSVNSRCHRNTYSAESAVWIFKGYSNSTRKYSLISLCQMLDLISLKNWYELFKLKLLRQDFHQ